MASQSNIGPDAKVKRSRMDKFIPRRSSTLSSSVGPTQPTPTTTPERTPAKSERTRMDKIMRRPSTSSTLSSSPPSKPLAEATPPKERSGLRKVLQRSNTSASSIGLSTSPTPLPESTLPKAAGSRIPRRTSTASIRAATAPSDTTEADGAKPERSRVDKLLRRSPSSSSSLAGVAPTGIPEPNGPKSERSRMDKILRRSPSSTSSLAISASPEAQDATPSKPESKRKRIASLIHRPDASSSDSISIAPTDADVQDGSPKPKRTRPGSVLRTLSAFSVKHKHGSSSSESLAVDTHTPPAVEQTSVEHKMLSPVAESPAVEQGHQGFASLPVSSEAVPPSISEVVPPVPLVAVVDPTPVEAPATAAPAVAPEVQAEISEPPPPVDEPAAPAAQLDLPPGLTEEPSSYDEPADASAPDATGDASEEVAEAVVAMPPSHEDTTVAGSLDNVVAEEPLIFDAPAIPQENVSLVQDSTFAAPDVPLEEAEQPVTATADVPAISVQPVASDDASARAESEVDGPNSSVEATKATSFVDAGAARETEPPQTQGDVPSVMSFEQFGWIMHHSPGESAPYFTLHGHDVVTDVDLRGDGAILSIYERLSCLDMPPADGWELWLLNTIGGFVPSPDHYLVNHDLRVVSSTPKSPRPTAAEREKYWEFVEKHPVHCARIISSEEIVAGTNDALTYEFVKWPVPPGSGSGADSVSDVPFNEDESDEFSRSLSSFGDPSTSTPEDMAVVAQNVAKVELRLCRWEQRMRESGRLGEERYDSPSGALMNLSPDAQRQMIPALSRVLGGSVGRSGAWGCSIQ
ncbi:unnamed protein product [Peniophora sp. CBMAI 1063]|nr:unnamed protein product [Peniophora sp. CBMAI 1063]